MRIAIVADVHSNLAALEAVLRDAEAESPLDAVWCLGDLVGYGPEPSGVIAALRRRQTAFVAGNHDLAACGRMDTDEFNAAAAEAALWTGRQLSHAEADFLRRLPLTHRDGDWTLVHGSLRSPEWEYLLSAEQALTQFGLQKTPYSLVGHSHIPFWIEERAGGAPGLHRASDGEMLVLGDTRLILNPGSVGQPRDGDPRASYILYDQAAATVTWHRVEYDIAATQRKMREAGLPAWLSERLSAGL